MNAKNELAPLFNLSLVVVSLSYGLLHTVAAFAGLFGLPLKVLLWLSAWRYAYAVLRSIAQGHRELATPGMETLNPFAEIPLVVHFLLFPTVIGVLAGVETWPGLVRWPAVAVLAALIPASAALMAMTGNFAVALSPWHLTGLLARLGRDYLRLLALCAGLGAILWLGRAMPWPLLLGSLVGNTLDLWVSLGVFALTGALIREHRADFGIPGEVEPEDERAERERRREWQQTLDRAYAALRSGLRSQGYATIHGLVESEGRSLAVYQWLFDSMLRWEPNAPALEVGRQYVDRLLEAGEVHEALDLAAQCRRVSERFAVTADSARVLADYARSIGRAGLADDLEASVVVE